VLGAKEFGPLFIGVGIFLCLVSLAALLFRGPLTMLEPEAKRSKARERITAAALIGFVLGAGYAGISTYSLVWLNNPAQRQAAQESFSAAIARSGSAGHPFEEVATSFLCRVRCRSDRAISDVRFVAEQQLPPSTEGERWQVNLSWTETDRPSGGEQHHNCSAVFVFHANGTWTEAGTRLCSNPA
jgi:hypothetical protein